MRRLKNAIPYTLTMLLLTISYAGVQFVVFAFGGGDKFLGQGLAIIALAPIAGLVMDGIAGIARLIRRIRGQKEAHEEKSNLRHARKIGRTP